VIMYFD